MTYYVFLNNIPSQLRLFLEIIFYLHKEYQFSGLFWIWHRFNIWIFLWLSCVLCLYIFHVEQSHFCFTTFYTKNSEETFCKFSQNFYWFSYLAESQYNNQHFPLTWIKITALAFHFLDTFQPRSWRIFINKGSYPGMISLKLENIVLSAITCQPQSCQGLTFSSEYLKINLIWFLNEYSSLSLMEI